MSATTVITIGGDGTFVFSAAHAGLHDGEFEPLHGHTFIVTLRLHGDLDRAGMICDFTDAKAALAAAIEPLRRRVLMPASPPGGHCTPEDGQILIECGVKRYSLPAGDMTLLPVANTTTEAIADWLLNQVTGRLHAPGLRLAELVLAEAPDTSVTVSAQLGPVQ
jgi:6-pyruvoyltetrahydropterin/6-carboxytetrahydropterin synthase